jgi:hypothetical protein
MLLLIPEARVIVLHFRLLAAPPGRTDFRNFSDLGALLVVTPQCNDLMLHSPPQAFLA